MSDACLLCGLVDDTSTLCCLSSSCLWELVDVSITGEVCWLTTLSPLRLPVIYSIISSSDRGFNLCLFAPGYSVGLLIGVSSSLSLFLLLSWFRGVCSAGISAALVWARGTCTCSCSLDPSRWSVIIGCSVVSTSLPFEVPVTDVLVFCVGYWEVLVEDVPTPDCWVSLKDTYPKESRSRVFSRSFIDFSIFSCSLISAIKVPSTHSSWLSSSSISGILWCTYTDSLYFTLLSLMKLHGSYGTHPNSSSI